MPKTRSLRETRLGLAEALLADGLITEQRLRLARLHQEEGGSFLGESLVDLGFITPKVLQPYVEKATGFNFITLSDAEIDYDLARSIPEEFARGKKVLPVDANGRVARVAMADPANLALVDELRLKMGRGIEPLLALSSDVASAINRVFDVRHKAMVVIEEMTDSILAEKKITVDELTALAEDAPIVRLVNSILTGAIDSQASDIHIEPHEYEALIRYRIDGLLYDQTHIPNEHMAAIVSRIKIISKLNIAERRRPQDGRFTFRGGLGDEYDVRVSLMPTIYGEKVVMRLLEKVKQLASMARLGFSPEQQATFEGMIHRPHGMVLVTGPTGSGKSTTLYAALTAINSRTVNINTVEDPVEYHLDGANQVPVNARIGVTFATGLRTLVRQDPDVIMVGEIRDHETAEIAVQAALTGHLVLSTLHTNDAPGALVRLQNMGVEPFLISSAMLGVVGQRLLRTVCPICAESYPAPPHVVAGYDLPMVDDRPPMLQRGTGCPQCGFRGMRGRSAAYEVMPMTDPLRQLVLDRAAGSTIRAQAIREGMVTMRESGIKKLIAGTTSPEEMARVLASDID